MKKIMLVFGTRPEAIKMCPLVNELKSRETFDRNKLLNGLLRACEKRPVSIDQIENVVDSIEAQLQGGGFFRCHAAFLVNMRKVQHIDGNDLHLSDTVIPISKHRRREFMQELAAYWGNRA